MELINLSVIRSQHEKKNKKMTTRIGLESTRAEHIGLAVQRLKGGET